MPPRTNSKAVAGRERQKEQEVKKKAEEDRRKQELEDKDWQKGSNVKGQSRADEAATKADEAARKKREKEELLRQEEADNVKLEGKVKKAPTAQKGKKTKKQDNLSLLEDALVKTADQKHKAQKRLERETKLAHERETNKKASLQVPLDPLLANTETMLQVEAGRSINQQSMQMMASSGIDAALESMGLTGGVGKTSSMTYKDYEETMLPIVKQDFPGLRLTQYKEKVYQMWKKSPDNPNNQMPL